MSEQHDPLRLLHLSEAAKLVGLDAEFLKEQVEGGAIGAIRRGREWRIPRRSLEVWVERIATTPLQEKPAELPRRGRGRPPKNREAA